MKISDCFNRPHSHNRPMLSAHSNRDGLLRADFDELGERQPPNVKFSGFN